MRGSAEYARSPGVDGATMDAVADAMHLLIADPLHSYATDDPYVHSLVADALALVGVPEGHFSSEQHDALSYLEMDIIGQRW